MADLKKGGEQIEIQQGNLEILKVRLLGDISNNLRRIAEALEAQNAPKEK